MRVRIWIFWLLLAVAACSAQTPPSIPFELRHGLVYVRVGVNGSSPLNFIVDTGASHTVLGIGGARSLDLPLMQVASVKGGVGSSAPPAYLVTDAVSFSLSAVSYDSNSVVALPLEQLNACFSRLGDGAAALPDGILGRDFFTRFVVEIDYPARVLRLHSPESFAYKGEGTILPLELTPNFMFVPVHVKARKRLPATAKLVLDTGADVELSLNTKFAQAHGMVSAAAKKTASAECGIAGPQSGRTRQGRLEALHLGKEIIADPLAVFYKRTPARWYDGLLGGPALAGFKVMIDTSRNRLILERAPSQ
jgi:predicted aspartyl protease